MALELRQSLALTQQLIMTPQLQQAIKLLQLSRLELVETLQARCPGCWVFIYTFDSRHAGYGDRSDQMLAQVITPHKASVGVEQGKVGRAILDGEWDMIAQEMTK